MNPNRGEQGLTLTELMVVIVLAAVVMTGLIVFYLNAQALWLDGSSQAITQRELTLALRTIGKRARNSASALTSGSPTVDLQLDLFNATADPESTFSVWLAPDSTLHTGYPYATDPARLDVGPMIQSRAVVLAAHSDANMVYIDSICVLTPQGSRVTMSTSTALMNRTLP